MKRWIPAGIKVIPDRKESLERFKRSLRFWVGIREVCYYKSDNIFFNRYPCSSASRIQLVEQKLIQEQLEGAEKLG